MRIVAPDGTVTPVDGLPVTVPAGHALQRLVQWTHMTFVLEGKSHEMVHSAQWSDVFKGYGRDITVVRIIPQEGVSCPTST